MKTTTYSIGRGGLVTATLLGMGLAMMALPSSAAVPPAGRTYFVVSLGLAADRSEAYEPAAGCIEFRADEICESDGTCGDWWLIEEGEGLRRQWLIGFDFSIVDDASGAAVEIAGFGRVDARGRRSSFAAAAHGVEPATGAKINFSIAGREVGARRCERLVAEFADARR